MQAKYLGCSYSSAGCEKFQSRKNNQKSSKTQVSGNIFFHMFNQGMLVFLESSQECWIDIKYSTCLWKTRKRNTSTTSRVQEVSWCYRQNFQMTTGITSFHRAFLLYPAKGSKNNWNFYFLFQPYLLHSIKSDACCILPMRFRLDKVQGAKLGIKLAWKNLVRLYLQDEKMFISLFHPLYETKSILIISWVIGHRSRSKFSFMNIVKLRFSLDMHSRWMLKNHHYQY